MKQKRESRHVEISNETVVAKVIELTSIDSGRHVIGPSAEIKRCKLNIHVGHKLFGIVPPSKFSDCVIHCQRLINFQDWWNVKLDRCAFEGRYEGNDFGHRRKPTSEPPEWLRESELADSYGHVFGDVVECDFSRASLHQCRFFNVDRDGVGLPSSPHLTIYEPNRIAALLPRLKIPSIQKVLWEVAAGQDLEVSMLVWDLRQLAKQQNIQEDDVKVVLKQLPEQSFLLLSSGGK